MRFDELGIRIKQYEAQTTKTTLMPSLPVYARIDGRAFHTFCRGLKKPFCYELVETMQEATKFLVEETHAQLGYVQSDEISLCWLDIDKAPFDGKLFKLQSVLASLATSKFVNCLNSRFINQILPGLADMYSVLYEVKETMPNIKINEDRIPEYLKSNQWYLLYEKCQKIIPSFDCRVFQLPNEMELANTFVWREIDAVRNSVSMLAQANFSHKELQGKDRKAMLTMLEEKGIRWNELRDDLKRGAYFKRVLVEKELDDETWNKIPDNKKPDSRTVTRSEIQRYDIPEMKNVANKVGVYFYGEKPFMKISDDEKVAERTF
jgi:tRNA(His) 5'-end guanylyltransferase